MSLSPQQTLALALDPTLPFELRGPPNKGRKWPSISNEALWTPLNY